MTRCRQAAVVLAFHRDPSRSLNLVVIERARGGRHGGQVSLPGGNLEPHDHGAPATAIRETCEEIGTTPEQVQILEALNAVTTNTTNYRVWPFIARVETPPPHRWRPDPTEALAVIELPLDHLAEPAARGEAEFDFPGWDKPRLMPTRTVIGHVLWALTLRIIEPHLEARMGGRS